MAGGTELFGSPLGDRAFAEDAHTRSLARLQSAEADKAQLQVQQERQFAQLMRIAGSGTSPVDQMQPGNDDTFGDFTAPSDSMGPKLARLAQLATQAGLVDRGAKLAAQAANISNRYASARAANAVASLRGMRQRKEEAGMLGSAMEDVHDQASYDQAMAAIQMATGRMSRFAGLPYSPELRDQLRSQALAVKDQRSLDIREADAASRKAFREQRLEQHDNELAVSMAARGVRLNREGRFEKLGGGKMLTVSKQDRDAADALILKDFPELSSNNNERFVAANTVAAAAKALMQRNPALDMQEALAQAYTAERGNFKTEDTLMGYGKRKVKFEGGGKVPQTALPKPADLKDLRPGRYYYSESGAIGHWDGKQMQPVRGNAPKPPTTPEPDDTEEE